MSALQKIVNPVVRTSGRRSMSSYIETMTRPTYDVLPKPKGSWQEDFNKRNSAANRLLVIGSLATIGCIAHFCYDPSKKVTRADLPIDPRTH